MERPRRRRTLAAALLCGAGAWCLGPQAWLQHRPPGAGAQQELGPDAAQRGAPPPRRREALASAAAATFGGAVVAPSVAFAEEQRLAPGRLDEYGRPLLPDGKALSTEGLVYDGVATFNGKPKVFLAGSTGELGRRVSLDLLRSGYSVYLGIRDEGRAMECQYANRKSARYEMTVVKDALIQGGREQELQSQLSDASVVIDVAGARFGIDVLRPGVGLDPTDAERTDLNGTKALIDAAVAKGVKKFIYVSAILTNARAVGDAAESDQFKNWNRFGNVLDNKHQAEEYLKRSGLDYTIIRPAPMTNDFPKDVGGIWFAPPDSILLKPNEVGSVISRDDVSLAVADAVFNKKASRATVELVGVPKRPPTPRELWWEPKDPTKPSA